MILPLLALLASLFAPIAKPIHESMEAASAPTAFQSADTVTPDSDRTPHHDAAHCSICVAINALKVIAISVALVSLLAFESAPKPTIPAYLEPATSEPSLVTAIPRGPPALA